MELWEQSDIKLDLSITWLKLDQVYSYFHKGTLMINSSKGSVEIDSS